MDMFIEKIVKRRKDAMDMAITAAVVIVALVASFLLFVFVPGFSPLLVAGVLYLAYFIISKRNIEFEYAVTNGDLDIDSIINQKKRKRAFSANCKDFEMVAKVKSDKYSREIKECKNVKDYSSHNEHADVWFIYMRQGAPTVILFEPTAQMIDNFYTFIPRKVFKY